MVQGAGSHVSSEADEWGHFEEAKQESLVSAEEDEAQVQLKQTSETSQVPGMSWCTLFVAD